MNETYRIIMNGDKEGTWKEAVILSFRVVFRHLSGGTKDSWLPADMNQVPQESGSEVLMLT
jgi:hypothetical protein